MTFSPSAMELEALHKFRKCLVDLDLKDYQQTDEYLLRWLRARDLNCQAALAMLQKHLLWRKENQVDEISAWQPPEQFLRDYPLDFGGFDKEGSPIMTVPYGRWDVRKAAESGQIAQWLRYFIQFFEKVEATLRELNQGKPLGQKVTQIRFLADLDGFAFRQIACRAVVEASLKATTLLEDHYPEILKSGIMVNTPKAFMILYSLAKPLLTARTLSKIELLGSDAAQWRAHLQEVVPAKHLIRPMGGLRLPSKAYLKLIGAPMTTASGCEDDLCEVSVKAGQNLTLDVNVERSNATLSWRFQTDGDIGFSLENAETGKFLISPGLLDSHRAMQSGSLEGLAAGKYLMNFSNKHIMMRPKTLRYTFSVVYSDE